MGNRNEQLAQRRAYEVTGYTLHTALPDLGLEVYTKPLQGDAVIAKAFRGRAAKPAWFYKFNSAADLETYIGREIESRKQHAEYKAKLKAERNQPADVAVGDIFEASWGYDQTNIDYYQVTRVIGPVTIEVRKIGAVRWETGLDQGRCVPAPDNFIGSPMRKRVQSYNGEASIRIASYCYAYRMKPVVDGVPAYASSHWTAYA